MTQPIYYAIGDIHGEAEKLIRLHNCINRNHEKNFPGRNFVIVHLGDYVDRGPDSFEVIDMLMKIEPADKSEIINLKGNHEQMMLDACSDDGETGHNNNFWIRNGGDKTLESYDRAGFNEPPKRHIDWLKTLRSYHWDRAANLIFVHAGIDPEHFPKDGEDRHLWTRSSKFFDTRNWGEALPKDTRVIHGHTPTQSGSPDVDGGFRRINVDTGACYGGELTAVVLAPNETPKFLSV